VHAVVFVGGTAVAVAAGGGHSERVEVSRAGASWEVEGCAELVGNELLTFLLVVLLLAPLLVVAFFFTRNIRRRAIFTRFLAPG
jgi:hypothetical protein